MNKRIRRRLADEPKAEAVRRQPERFACERKERVGLIDEQEQ